MATHEHRPTTAPSEAGNSGPPSGWYPDPQGSPGLRWWDGAHWADQVVMPTTPPAKRASWDDLTIVFCVELVLAFGAFFLAGILVMGLDSCESDRCGDLYLRAWLLLIAVSLALPIVCGAAFLWASRAKWVVAKLLAVFALPIGTMTGGRFTW
jgi:Protein of unknown function (DUF2510)